jgi:hypothetical protein
VGTRVCPKVLYTRIDLKSGSTLWRGNHVNFRPLRQVAWVLRDMSRQASAKRNCNGRNIARDTLAKARLLFSLPLVQKERTLNTNQGKFALVEATIVVAIVAISTAITLRTHPEHIASANTIEGAQTTSAVGTTTTEVVQSSVPRPHGAGLSYCYSDTVRRIRRV